MTYEGGTRGLWGSVQLSLDDLAAGLELTRRENAICLATDLVTDPLISLTELQAEVGGDRASDRLRLAMQRLDIANFVARAFGEFDDSTVGVEVFATGPMLDAISPSK